MKIHVYLLMPTKLFSKMQHQQNNDMLKVVNIFSPYDYFLINETIKKEVTLIPGLIMTFEKIR